MVMTPRLQENDKKDYLKLSTLQFKHQAAFFIYIKFEQIIV